MLCQYARLRLGRVWIAIDDACQLLLKSSCLITVRRNGMYTPDTTVCCLEALRSLVLLLQNTSFQLHGITNAGVLMIHTNSRTCHIAEAGRICHPEGLTQVAETLQLKQVSSWPSHGENRILAYLEWRRKVSEHAHALEFLRGILRAFQTHDAEVMSSAHWS